MVKSFIFRYVLYHETQHVVTMAYGSKLVRNSKCIGFTWTMQDQIFTHNMRIVGLGEYGMVLGAYWMKKYNLVMSDYILK